MRIGIAFMTCGKDIFGGIDNALFNLSLGFQEHGIDVFAYSSHVFSSDPVVGPMTVYRSSFLPRELPEGHQQQAIIHCIAQHKQEIREEFFDFVREKQIDCVITCDPIWGILQQADACVDAPCPIILSLHVAHTKETLQRARQIPYLFRQVISPWLKTQLEQRCSGLDLLTIPNSINGGKFCPGNNAGRTSSVIFCNARVSKDKGTIYIIRAFAAFIGQYPQFELWLCTGDYPFGDRTTALQEVQYEIDRLGISSKVRLLPHLSWDDIAEITRQSFAVALPTLSETFGRAAIETLACGVPLVVSAVDNIPHLVQNAALLTVPRSPQSLCQALTTLVHDPELYARLCIAGPTVAARYDNVFVAQQFLEAIQERLL